MQDDDAVHGDCRPGNGIARTTEDFRIAVAVLIPERNRTGSKCLRLAAP